MHTTVDRAHVHHWWLNYPSLLHLTKFCILLLIRFVELPIIVFAYDLTHPAELPWWLSWYSYGLELRRRGFKFCPSFEFTALLWMCAFDLPYFFLYNNACITLSIQNSVLRLAVCILHPTETQSPSHIQNTKDTPTNTSLQLRHPADQMEA